LVLLRLYVFKRVVHNLICITPSIVYRHTHRFQSTAVVYENLIIPRFMKDIIIPETIILGTASCFKNTCSLFSSRRTVNCGLTKTLIYFFNKFACRLFTACSAYRQSLFTHTHINTYYMVCVCVIKYCNSRPKRTLYFSL
jgi:hypothetical protein